MDVANVHHHLAVAVPKTFHTPRPMSYWNETSEMSAVLYLPPPPVTPCSCTTHAPCWGLYKAQLVDQPGRNAQSMRQAREAEPPTAKGEGGGPGVSVGGMVGVAIGGGAVGCPCRLGLARRRQVALKSTFADVSQRQNGPLWRTKYPCAQFRTSNTCGDRWGLPKDLPNKGILNPIPVPIRPYTVWPYWRIYPCCSYAIRC